MQQKNLYLLKKMNEVYIYTIEHPEDGQARYIGKTIQKLEKRLKAHIYESNKKNNHKCNWLSKMISDGFKPIIKLLDIVSESDWKFWECYWIEQFQAWNFNLVNQTPGGEGYKHTQETKEKIKQANSGINCYMYGKKLGHETKEKISKSLKGNTRRRGKKSSSETIQKNRKNASRYWLGKKRNQETINKIKINRKGKGLGSRLKVSIQLEILNLVMERIDTFQSIRQASRELKMNARDIKKLLISGQINNKRKVYFRFLSQQKSSSAYRE